MKFFCFLMMVLFMSLPVTAQEKNKYATWEGNIDLLSKNKRGIDIAVMDRHKYNVTWVIVDSYTLAIEATSPNSNYKLYITIPLKKVREIIYRKNQFGMPAEWIRTAGNDIEYHLNYNNYVNHPKSKNGLRNTIGIGMFQSTIRDRIKAAIGGLARLASEKSEGER